MSYLLAFFLSLVLAVLLTEVVKSLALKFKILDYPGERKIHQKPIPLAGGISIYLAFLLTVLFFSIFTSYIIAPYVPVKYIIGIFVGGLVLVAGGLIDDKYNIPPSKQLFFTVLAVLIIIAAGIGIEYITNPFGGVINLDNISFTLFTLGSLPYKITLLADLLTFCWLMGMMYTTKFLDGLDGLVAGIGGIASIFIFFLSLSHNVAQPEIAHLAIIFSGACFGFLVFNFYPARIFLGEGGSVLVGFILGILSIMAGSKIATALLLLGIPILDVLWVIMRRTFWEKKSPFHSADKKHLHFRILSLGLSQKQAVLLFYFLTTLFGLNALFFSGPAKLYSLIALVFFMLTMAIFLVIKEKRKNKS